MISFVSFWSDFRFDLKFQRRFAFSKQGDFVDRHFYTSFFTGNSWLTLFLIFLSNVQLIDTCHFVKFFFIFGFTGFVVFFYIKQHVIEKTYLKIQERKKELFLSEEFTM